MSQLMCFRSSGSVLAGAVLLILLQSCSPDKFETSVDNSDSTIQSSRSIAAVAPALPPPGVPRAAMPPVSGAGSGVVSPLPIVTPVPVSPPAPAQAPVAVTEPVDTSTCDDHMNALGQSSFSGPIQVDLNPIDNIGLGGEGNERFAYMGFGISFNAKTPVGEPLYFKKLHTEATGFVVKFRDVLSNTVVTVPNSAYTTIPLLPLETNSGYAVSNSNPLKPSKRLDFQVASSFYFANRSVLNNVKVELYCFEKLVASGLQDFKSLEYPLNKTYKLAPSGTGYVSSDAVNGFIHLGCPTEVAAGTTLLCTAGGLGLENVFWVINGSRFTIFDRSKTMSFPNAPAGVHSVQAIAVLSNGKEMRSLIRTVVIR